MTCESVPTDISAVPMRALKRDSHVDWAVSLPESVLPPPKVQYLRMWPYLEVGLFQIYLVKMRSELNKVGP